MNSRVLGATGLRVSEVGFGCSRLGGFTAAGLRRKDSVRLVQEAVERGITLFDTADAYANGDSERLLGEALRGRRQRVVLCTKGGYEFREHRVGQSPIAPVVFAGTKLVRKALGVQQFARKDFSHRALSRALEASLRRLNTDYIDLYQLHGPLSSEGHLEALEHLRRFQREGKIRHFGLGLETLEGFDAWSTADDLGAVQIPFGLLDPEALDGPIPHTAERGVGLLVRSVLGGSLLGSKLTDTQLREMTPQWSRISAFRELAAELGCELQSLAMRYALSPSGVSAAILGMYTAEHLQRTLSLSCTPLPADVLARIAKIRAEHPPEATPSPVAAGG